MAKSLERYATDFAAHNPEAGSAEVGVLNPDMAWALAETMSGRVAQLSRKEEPLTADEAGFVNAVVDNGSRVITGMLAKGAKLPQDEAFARTVERVDKALPPQARGRKGFGVDWPVTSGALGEVASGQYGIGDPGQNADNRRRVEDLAMAIPDMMAGIADHAAVLGHPVEIDQPMQDNLRLMMAWYDEATPQPPVQ